MKFLHFNYNSIYEQCAGLFTATLLLLKTQLDESISAQPFGMCLLSD